MSTIIRLLINALAVIIAAYFIPGVAVASVRTAVIVAIVLAVLNWTVKPLLLLLTLPITILTLGLFTLVINTVIILIASNLVTGFSVDSFWTAFIYSIVLAIVSGILSALLD